MGVYIKSLKATLINSHQVSIIYFTAWVFQLPRFLKESELCSWAWLLSHLFFQPDWDPPTHNLAGTFPQSHCQTDIQKGNFIVRLQISLSQQLSPFRLLIELKSCNFSSLRYLQNTLAFDISTKKMPSYKVCPLANAQGAGEVERFCFPISFIWDVQIKSSFPILSSIPLMSNLESSTKFYRAAVASP